MLKSIELKNYRCFEQTKMNYRDLTVIVGSNNSGKSTIIEALRIISSVVKKFKNTQYINPPFSLNLPVNRIGIKVSLNNSKIDLKGIVYFYNDSEAVITAIFDNNVRVIVTLNHEWVFANIYAADGQLVNSKSKARYTEIENISIMPQLGLIKDEEKLLTSDTVKSDMETYLSSRHFRNELLLLG